MPDPKVRDMLLANVDDLTRRMTELVDEVREVTEQLHPERARSCRHWSGTWETKIRGTVTHDSDGWVACLRLEDPAGLSPITTVGRYDTVEAVQVATDHLWASR
jgi:hypothetical protein